MNDEKYIEQNREGWNAKTGVHVASEFYDVPGFLKGKSSLNEIELGLLGDVSGKSILHLQCHFGQDSISLSRLGADVTGVDFSDAAIEKARELAAQSNVTTSFVCCDVYEVLNKNLGTFDIVFTSYGTIGWLPDLDRWANVISQSLKPGGKFVFVEFHPVVWMFDNDFQKIQYNYFKADPIVEMEDGTYADRNAPLKHEMTSWNHSLSEVIKALLRQNLSVTSFMEYDYSPYNCLNGMIETSPGKYNIEHLGNKIPMVYSLTASKIE